MTEQIKNRQLIQKRIVEEGKMSNVDKRSSEDDDALLVAPPPPPEVQSTNVDPMEEIEEEDEDFDEELENYINKRTRIERPKRQMELLPSTAYFRDEKGLNLALQKLQRNNKRNTKWIDHLSSTSKRPLGIVNPDDPFERELKYVEQVTPTITEGLSQLRKSGIPTDRPNDYFAEMVKSDEHMFKVKEILKKSNEALERRERKRVEKDYKKLSKAIQQKRAKEKAQEKRDNLKAIQTWKNIARKVKSGEYENRDEDEDDDYEVDGSDGKSKGGNRRRKKGKVPDFDKFMKSFRNQRKSVYNINMNQNQDEQGEGGKEGRWLDQEMEKMRVGSRDYQTVGGFGVKKNENVQKKRHRRGKRQSKRKRQRRKK